MTIASMMPSALKRICRSAAAMGPFGSRTPSVQPASAATPIKTMAVKTVFIWVLVASIGDSLRVRQGVRDQSVARWRHHEVMAARHDEQVLLAILLVDDRRGLAAGREHVTPQDVAGLDVDRLDQIVGRRRDEDQAARGHNRPSVIRGANLERNEGGHAERSVAPGRTERTIPQRFAGCEIDRADAAIRGA